MLIIIIIQVNCKKYDEAIVRIFLSFKEDRKNVLLAANFFKNKNKIFDTDARCFLKKIYFCKNTKTFVPNIVFERES